MKPGYWRRTADSLNIYECPSGKRACGGGNHSEGYCISDNGYEGVFCSSCQFGWFMNNQGVCKKCGGKGERFMLSITLLSVTIVVSLAAFLQFGAGRLRDLLKAYLVTWYSVLCDTAKFKIIWSVLT